MYMYVYYFCPFWQKTTVALHLWREGRGERRGGEEGKGGEGRGEKRGSYEHTAKYVCVINLQLHQHVVLSAV